MSDAWRTLGDISADTFAAELARVGSPILPEASAAWAASRPHAALALAMADHETKLGTWTCETAPTGQPCIPAAYRNPLALKSGGRFAAFPTYAAAFAEWRRRLTEAPVYQATRTLPELIHTYAPGSDGNDESRYVAEVVAAINRYRAQEDAVPPNMSKGLVPPPPINRRLITTKPAGVGWDDLGRRTVRGVTLHRMQGTLWGTDGYFRRPEVRALTDFGVDHMSGECLQWADPRGTVTPWASGPVSSPYGDGAAFLARYAGPSGVGASVVNRDRVSIELSGFFAQPGEVEREDPWAPASEQVVAQLIAHYAHDYGIPWDKWPNHPDEGFSFVCWHHEFTAGTGKLCPGALVKERTSGLVERVRGVLRAAQTAGAISGTTTAAPATTAPPFPPPAYPWPAGMSEALAREWFGRATDAQGRVYAYDPRGAISALWRDRGVATGQWPALLAVEVEAAGPVAGARYFRFADDWVVWVPPGGVARVLRGTIA